MNFSSLVAPLRHFSSLCPCAPKAALLSLCLVSLLPAQAETFNANTRYSREVIDACLYHFKANQKDAGFAEYNADGTLKAASESARGFDYVPGLVAKAVLEAIQYYQDSAFVAPWFYSMQAYGNLYYDKDHASSATLDDLNACKLYFGLAELTKSGAKFAADSTYQKCQTAKSNTLAGLNAYNTDYVISSSTSASFAAATDASLDADTYTGGWWHKSSYKNEMWCDGQYMGPALLAQLLHEGYTLTGKTETECWDLIAKQFSMTWGKLWDSDKQLLYHAFSAEPASDSYWADQTTGAHYGVSSEFWGRADGWYFLALIDVLEYMPSTHAQYATLKNYLNLLAAGLAARQDASTGVWCQLLQYANETTPAGCSKENYLEASGSALFVAGFLKGQRLGLFNTDYSALAQQGYKGLVEQFLTTGTDGNKYMLIHSCASAGLSDSRKGDANYYLNDNGDAKKITTYTEGKILGAFIFAAIEYERAYMKNTPTDNADNTIDNGCKCLHLELSATKLLRNGQFLIAQSDRLYSATGARY